MNFSTFIARRYLISKKTQNVINIISLISVIGIATGTMALIIVLSVYNGFEGLIQNMYGAFDADLKITPAKGKFFKADSTLVNTIALKYHDFEIIEVLEENVLLKYGEKMQPAIMKGVSHNFIHVSGFDSLVSEGQLRLDTAPATAVCGQGLAYYLGMGLHFLTPVTIYAPRTGARADLPETAFNTAYFFPSGFFSVQPDIDVRYFLIDYHIAARVMGYNNLYSAYELISLKRNIDYERIKAELISITGDKYIIKTKYEQHELLYKIMKSEKLVIYAILSFILLIASFNVIGSITMLIIEKKHDMAVLQALGLKISHTRKIFMFEGMFITISGAIAGLLIGLLICWLQIHYHLIKLGDAAYFVIDYYPVEIRIADIAMVFLIVTGIGLFASWYPVRILTGKYFKIKE